MSWVTDSVDGNDLVFEKSTKWLAAWGYAWPEWNSKMAAVVAIRPDDAWSVADLEVKDANQCGVSWVAQYSHRVLAIDTIEANNCYFKSMGDVKKRNAFTHELGHALGIKDHYGIGWSGVLMYYAINGVTTVKPHDGEDFFDAHD